MATEAAAEARARVSAWDAARVEALLEAAEETRHGEDEQQQRHGEVEQSRAGRRPHVHVVVPGEDDDDDEGAEEEGDGAPEEAKERRRKLGLAVAEELKTKSVALAERNVEVLVRDACGADAASAADGASEAAAGGRRQQLIVTTGTAGLEDDAGDARGKTGNLLWSLAWKRFAVFPANEELPEPSELATLVELSGPSPPDTSSWRCLSDEDVRGMREAWSEEDLTALHSSLVDGIFRRSGGRPWQNASSYVLTHFARHMVVADRRAQVYFLVVNVNWVLAKLLSNEDAVFRSLVDVDLTIAESEAPQCVSAISRAVRSSRALVLKTDPARRKQLASELLWNKLAGVQAGGDRYFHMFVHNLSSLRKLLAGQSGGPCARWPVLASAMDPLMHRYKGLDLGFLQSISGTGRPQRFACAGSKGILALVSSETGHILSSTPAHAGWGINGLQFVPALNVLVSASLDTTCKLWRLNEASEFEAVATFAEHKDSVRALCCTSSFAASGADDGTVLVWSLPECKVLHSFQNVHQGWCLDVDLAMPQDFSSSEDCLLHVASCADDGLGHVWINLRPADNPDPIVLRGHSNNVTAIRFLDPATAEQASSMLRVATGSADLTIRIWGLSDWNEGSSTNVETLVSLAQHKGEIRSLCVWNDLLVSASSDRTLKVWHVPEDTGAAGATMVADLVGHADAVNAIIRVDEQFSSSEAAGQSGFAFLSASDDKSVLWWDVEGLEEETSALRTQQPDAGGESDIAGHSEAPTEGPESESESDEHQLRKATVTALSVTPEHHIYGCKTGTVFVVEALTGLVAQNIKAHAGEVSAVCANDNVVATGSGDQTVILWDKQTWKQICSFGAHISRVEALRIDGNLLFSGGRDKFVHVYDLETCKMVFRLRGHKDTVTAFSAVGGIAAVNLEKVFLSASADNTIRCWNLDDGLEIRMLTGHEASVLGVEHLGPVEDKEVVLSFSSDGSIRSWDLVWGQPLRVLQSFTCPVLGMQLTASRQLVYAWTRAGQVGAWDVATGEKVFSFQAPQSDAAALADPDHVFTAGALLDRKDAPNLVICGLAHDQGALLLQVPSSNAPEGKAMNDVVLVLDSRSSYGQLDHPWFIGPIERIAFANRQASNASSTTDSGASQCSFIAVFAAAGVAMLDVNV